MKNPTLTQLANSSIVRNMARIIDLLQWTKQVYDMHIYENGIQYLHQYYGSDKEAVKIMERHADFWNWWKSMWNARNEVFVNEWDGLEDAISHKDLRKLYFDTHNVKVLVAEIAPPSFVYPENFTTIKIEM